MTISQHDPWLPYEITRSRASNGWQSNDLSVVMDTRQWIEPSTGAEIKSSEYNGQKLALAAVEHCEDETLKVFLRCTTWRDVQRVRAKKYKGGGTCVERDNLGKFVIAHPNILSAHCVCVTSDNKISVFQRSHLSAYYPGAWSATFEEGLEPSDYHGANTFRFAARRGVMEEISESLLDLPFESIYFLSVIVELDACNPAAVLLVRIPQTAKQLVALIVPNAELVSDSLLFVDTDPSAFAAFLLGMPNDGREWHPTSRYRLNLAQTFLKNQLAPFKDGV